MGLESAPIVMVITLLRSDFKFHGYPEWWEALKTHNLAPKAACIVTSDVSSSHHFLPDSNLDSDDPKFQCETCVLAKTHRIVFPSSDNKNELPFTLVHFDVGGTAKVSSTGKSPFLQGKRGSEEKKSCFEEDKEELLQATNQDVPINWLFSTREHAESICDSTGRLPICERSFSNKEYLDEHLVLEVAHDVSEEQLQNTTPHALPSSQLSCDEETLEVVLESLNMVPYTLPPRSNMGKPKLQYRLDLNAKLEYHINNPAKEKQLVGHQTIRENPGETAFLEQRLLSHCDNHYKPNLSLLNRCNIPHYPSSQLILLNYIIPNSQVQILEQSATMKMAISLVPPVETSPTLSVDASYAVQIRVRAFSPSEILPIRVQASMRSLSSRPSIKKNLSKNADLKP
ncbi:unnamed protein product [Prunus armeniaca]